MYLNIFAVVAFMLHMTLGAVAADDLTYRCERVDKEFICGYFLNEKFEDDYVYVYTLETKN